MPLKFRYRLLLIIYLCAGTQVRAADLASLRTSLVTYSQSTDLEERIRLALSVSQTLTHRAGKEPQSGLSPAEMKVINNANHLLNWVIGEARKYEISLHNSLRLQLTEGIDHSLVGEGVTAVPLVGRQCEGAELQSASYFVDQPDRFKDILLLLFELINLDRHMNRSFYYQKLLRLTYEAPPVGYADAIRAYLKNYISKDYEHGETVTRLQVQQQAIRKRKQLEAELKALGVTHAQQLVARLTVLSPNCL